VTAPTPTTAMPSPSRRVRGLILALLAVLAAPAAAELTATLEPRIVDEFDTARLTIRATGTNQTTALDLEALEEDFEVLTTQSSSQYRSINGRVESWVEYQVLLRPTRSGDLTVPPVGVGGEATEPLTLRVRGMSAELRQAIERMVFFETELTRDPVYVQSQTVLIRRLYYSSGAQIYSDLPGMPEIPGAIVTPLGETTSTATITKATPRKPRVATTTESQTAWFSLRAAWVNTAASTQTTKAARRMNSGMDRLQQ